MCPISFRYTLPWLKCGCICELWAFIPVKSIQHSTPCYNCNGSLFFSSKSFVFCVFCDWGPFSLHCAVQNFNCFSFSFSYSDIALQITNEFNGRLTANLMQNKKKRPTTQNHGISSLVFGVLAFDSRSFVFFSLSLPFFSVVSCKFLVWFVTQKWEATKQFIVGFVPSQFFHGWIGSLYSDGRASAHLHIMSMNVVRGTVFFSFSISCSSNGLT